MNASTTLTYEAILASQQRTPAWRVEDLIGGERRLDFTKPFMPEGLADVEPLRFLSPDERRTLNQIRGHEYLSIFGLVEEFILPFVLDHARARLRGDNHRVRALLQFAGEEAKHIHLFKRFREEFVADFGTVCNVIGPPEAVAAEVLKRHPLAVALLILHIEWMTQKHYLQGVKDNREIDPLFRSLLKHHWMEEANHAKLDMLMVQALGESASREERAAAFEQYLDLGMFLDRGLAVRVLRLGQDEVGGEGGAHQLALVQPAQHGQRHGAVAALAPVAAVGHVVVAVHEVAHGFPSRSKIRQPHFRIFPCQNHSMSARFQGRLGRRIRVFRLCFA